MKKLFIGLLLTSILTMLLSVSAQTTPTKLRVGLGYLPDIQFAPFYVGTQSNYAKFNLDVTFQHGFTSELYPLLAQGKLDFVVGDAEDVPLLRAQNPKSAPFKYIFAMYQEVPNVLFSKKEKNIKTLADLRDKRIGVPGKYGTSWTSLQAVLRAAKLKETDVKIEQIGFTQLDAVLADRVDVAVGFTNNEPVVLAGRGIQLNVIPLGKYNRSPGNGIIASEAMLKNAAVTKRFLTAVQDNMATIISKPQVGFDASKAFVQNLSEDRLKVLEASIPLYQSSFSRVAGLGFSNPKGWDSLLELLSSTGRLSSPVLRNDVYSNSYLRPGFKVK